MTGLEITLLSMWVLTLICFAVVVFHRNGPEPGPKQVQMLLEDCDLERGALVYCDNSGHHAWYPIFGKDCRNMRVPERDRPLFGPGGLLSEPLLGPPFGPGWTIAVDPGQPPAEEVDRG